MSFDRLNYGRNWTSPQDFPTYEDSETQVREDLQYHPEAVRTFLNEVLLPALESEGGAAKLGAAGGTVQQILDKCIADIETLASGGVPSVVQCVRVDFTEESWTEIEETGDVEMVIPQATHLRRGNAFGTQLFQIVDGEEVAGTWGTVSTVVSGIRQDGTIRITAPEPYQGYIAFFGV